MNLPPGALSASVQVLTLAKGLHLVCVTAATPQRVGDQDELTLPAIHVGLGPGVPPEMVEIMAGPRNKGQWLFETRDMLVVKVLSGQAAILLTTIRGAPQPNIAVEVTRLDGKPNAQTSPAPPTIIQTSTLAPPASAASRPPEVLTLLSPAAPAPAPSLRTPGGRPSLSTRVDLHIARKGDVAYVNNYWAGALGERLPIEAFAISPLEGLSPDQLEYAAVTAAGAETGWIEGGQLCGSRGRFLALAGFAVRLTLDAAVAYECEYRGSFSSGRIVGPVRDGAMCASDPGDVLEAIQVFLLRRGAVEPAPLLIAAGSAEEDPTPPASIPEATRPVGPRFSVFREHVE